MNKAESLQDFYNRNPRANPFGLSTNNANGLGHFNVFTRENCFRSTPYNRRDFYKISLIIGSGRLYYADKWVDIDRPALLFSNPTVPYSWEAISDKQEGYFCLFTASFLQTDSPHFLLNQLSLFKVGGDFVFFVNEAQCRAVSELFEKMMEEITTNYVHKYDLLRNYLQLIIHEAMKMQPVRSYLPHSSASRVCDLFLDLLERQFPIDSQERTLGLRSAQDYANILSVHVNHLNRSVKEITGKTTTQHIAERLVKEAKALLIHSDWTISEIAYSLGFSYPPYFNNFFRKQTRMTPGIFREQYVHV
ncbi:MAG: helix-turn-helix transcriptional regulator [Pseudosphingobacterium sp.]|nr:MULTISPECIES: helix-turn-helix domain-containing protein [Olivibacter]MCL4638429.1 AraC family transcriptional regulator [Olivibacter sp. UJ_SKK_5.1]MDM8174663.1 helix-turn-helix transcriptional regulator [Olivibacter sp. 47]MDX3913583.1 helix-turn-helix transcriptional regulator [Pseudosphingobacterium sp.]QEL04346.1 helix-turn-helix domain-containing protein [Olivibacter sp. LS-1]